MSVSQVTITAIEQTVVVGSVGDMPLVQIGHTEYPASIVVRQVEAGPAGAPGVGIGARTLMASEALTAGDLVNVWNDAGTSKLRRASAAAKGREANGWVTAGAEAGALATLNLGGVSTSMSGLTVGKLFLSTTPGQVQSLAPTGPGQVVQRVGFAFTPAEFMFQPFVSITLSF